VVEADMRTLKMKMEHALVCSKADQSCWGGNGLIVRVNVSDRFSFWSTVLGRNQCW